MKAARPEAFQFGSFVVFNIWSQSFAGSYHLSYQNLASMITCTAELDLVLSISRH